MTLREVWNKIGNPAEAQVQLSRPFGPYLQGDCVTAREGTNCWFVLSQGSQTQGFLVAEDFDAVLCILGFTTAQVNFATPAGQVSPRTGFVPPPLPTPQMSYEDALVVFKNTCRQCGSTAEPKTLQLFTSHLQVCSSCGFEIAPDANLGLPPL